MQLKKLMLAVGLSLLTVAVAAQTPAKGGRDSAYPTRPIRVLMPFPAGGTPDALGRMVATQVESQLGGSRVVDNRTGANGMIAYELGAKGNPDGYTILHATPSFALNTIVFKKLAYDLHRDFTPITNIAQGFGYLMLVHPSVQATNVKELIAFAKALSKPLTYGTPGVGNTCIWPPNCSTRAPASTCCTCPTRGWRRHSTLCLAARST